MNLNEWIDLPPESKRKTSSQLQQADSTLLGTVTELVDAQNVAVAIDGVGDAAPDVVCPGSGRMWVGARVRCIRDSTGRVVRVEAMAVDELPDEAETRDMDATTQWISHEQAQLDARQGETAEALEEARTELSEKQTQLADELAAADQRLTDATTEASDAKSQAQSAIETATARLAPPIRSASAPSGSGTSVGQVWWQYATAALTGAIKGQWVWSGTAWVPTPLASSVLESVVADIIVGGTGSLDQAFIGQLVGDSAFLTNMYANRVVVSADNLVRDPNLMAPATNASRISTATGGTATIEADTDGGSGKNMLQIAGAVNDAATFDVRFIHTDSTPMPPVDVNPGEQYTVSCDFRLRGDAPTAATTMRLQLFYEDATGTYVASKATSYLVSQIPITGTTWNRTTLRADFTIPDGVARMRLSVNGVRNHDKLQFQSPVVRKKVGTVLIEDGAVTATKMTVTQELWGKLANFVQITTGMLIAGGAKITGELLADILKVLTRIVAGNPTGTAAELDPFGLHVYRKLLDGTRAEVARFGTDASDDYVGVLDSTGNTLASIDQNGGGAFQSVDAGDGLTYQGSELSDILYAAPQGVVASAAADAFPDSIASLRTSYGLCEIAFTAPVDGARMYKVSANFLLRQWGSATNVSVVYTTDGSRPMVNSTLMSRQTTPATDGGTDYTVHFETLWPMNLAAGQTVRLLLMIAEDGADSNIAFVNSMNPRFWVEDQGPAADFGGVPSSGGGTLPGSSSPTPPATTDPKRTYTKTYLPTWAQSYRLDGSITTGMDPYAVQGYGGGPARMSMIGFMSVVGDLSGADVKKVEVYLQFPHWYQNSGGTAGIGWHGSTSKPSTWGGTTANIQRGNIPKGGGVWVTLPSSTYAQWKSGGIRGITLRAPGDSTSTIFYGYADAGKARLRVTYAK